MVRKNTKIHIALGLIIILIAVTMCSGKQALEVANSLEADVVTLALEQDVSAIEEAGIIDKGFTDEFSNDS